VKILLVNPYWIFYPGTNRRPGGPPSIIATVAAAFLQAGCEVDIFDFMASDHIRERGEDILIWGKTKVDFLNFLVDKHYDGIGIKSAWTVQHTAAVDLADLLRATYPDVYLFAGGHHVSVCGDLEHFDLNVVGEVENCVLEIMAAIDAQQRDIVIQGSKVKMLDKLDFPAYSLLDLEYYRRVQRNHHGSLLLGGMPVITSRGCPYGCNFCTVHLTMGKKWCSNSPDYVFAHLLHLESLGFTNFHFEDDNLILSKNRWMSIMEKMATHQGFSWDTPNAVRLDTLDKDVVALAAKSGCKELRVSIETGSDAIRNVQVGKKLDIGSIYTIAAECKKHGIRLCSFYVVGIPGETIKDIKATLRLADRLERDHAVVPRYSIATPFPGTKMLQECLENGWLNVPYPYTEEQLAGATHKQGLITTPQFTPDDINHVYELWKSGKLR